LIRYTELLLEVFNRVVIAKVSSAAPKVRAGLAFQAYRSCLRSGTPAGDQYDCSSCLYVSRYPCRRSLPLEHFAAVLGIGAPLVDRRQEISTLPVADAVDLRSSERGEYYYYSLVNYLRVTRLLDDGRIIAVTRDNKRLCLSSNDSQLRKARFIERTIYRSRFPSVAAI
jgi:hypothetical protein